MIGKITQDNVHLLLPSKICWLAPWLMEEKSISMIEAITKIYSSEVYKKLEIEDTKMWHWSPVDLYSELIASFNE